ncbi:tetratricopeptide repeat protein [Bacillus sp. HSf4]|uniref:tetratricopeptide repeat protein n=1 Tax=Bacillus sp. HSf4 TaxID=3035514 RepID=UPI002409A125|nr:tetratricopeptide repeat protein [Bacillus sp. HSf4]WFA03719.1 tetratricopeptide repeat protein [Bacillus sp. HSf4]
MLKEAGDDPNASIESLKLLAVSEMQLDQYEGAEKHLKMVVKKDPSDHASHYNLAVVYARQGEWSKAEQSVRKALKEKPDEDIYQTLHDKLKKKRLR